MSTSANLETSEINPDSDIKPNWEREKCVKWWDPSRQLIKSIRNYQKLQNNKNPISSLIRTYFVMNYRFWTVVTGSDIPLNCQIGGGLLLPHPNGVVIHPDAVIGINCAIFQQVTIVTGVKIGNNVLIGAGAKILKNTTIGDGAKIGANAVVRNCIVPPKATAVGIPARIINKSQAEISTD
jgi:serine O-acetyltransferase